MTSAVRGVTAVGHMHYPKLIFSTTMSHGQRIRSSCCQGAGLRPTCQLLSTPCQQQQQFPLSLLLVALVLRCYGGNRVFHGPAHTVKCFECNTLVRKVG